MDNNVYCSVVEQLNDRTRMLYTEAVKLVESFMNTIKENNFKFTKLNHKFLIPKLKNMGSTTPSDLCEFYLKLDNEEFLDWECCNKMKQILLKQHYKDILTGKIQKSENENFLDVASKSGKADGRIYDNNTDSYIADAGIMICKNSNNLIKRRILLWQKKKKTF